MASQQNLFCMDEFTSAQPKKRVRYDVPTYKKAYSYWHINPKTGEVQFDGDERHIFRIKTLHNIYAKIYEELQGRGFFSIFERLEGKEIDGLKIWKDEYTRDNYTYRGQTFKGQEFKFTEAEIKGSEGLNIKQRVKAHIKLLRILRDKDHIYSSFVSIQKHRGFVIKN